MSKPLRRENENAELDKIQAQRISPFVEDRRNILLIKPAYPLEESAMASLQYAPSVGSKQSFSLRKAS